MRMSPILDRIPPTDLPGTSLYHAYLEGSDPVLVDRVGRIADAAHPVLPGAGLTEELAAELAAFNRSLGASEHVVDALARASTFPVRFVLTGQQPGALGGPLLTLYKVATAEALACEMERTIGDTVVPVYWMGADDDDFAEIRGWVAAQRDLGPVEAAFDGSRHEVGLPIGSIGVEADAALWGAVRALFGTEGSHWMKWIDDALDGARDHGDVCARLISGVFQGRVAVVDGRSGVVRRAARDCILAYVDREREVRDAVARGADILHEAGYHAQLTASGDYAGIFLMDRGRRVKIRRDRLMGMRSRFAAQPELASPGVVLRSLVQDAAFAPVAAVLGSAEVAYRAQIADVYTMLGVRRPGIFARMSATFVPGFAAGPLGEDVREVVLDPRGAAVRVIAAAMDPRVERAGDHLTDAVEHARREYEEELGPSAGHRKVRGRLEDVVRRTRSVADAAIEDARRQAVSATPWLAHLESFFLRAGTPQERYLWMFAPFALSNGAMDAIRDASAEHVRAALDGGVTHIVYSA